MTYESLLNSALPGALSDTLPASTRNLPEKPWKLWRSGKHQYIVFPVVGERMAQTSLDALKAAKKKNLQSILLIPETKFLPAIADNFLELEALVICPIAGKGFLLNKNDYPQKKKGKAKTPPSRIPLELLEQNLVSSTGHTAGSSHLKRLVQTYRKLKRDHNFTDAAEQKALETYAKGLLKEIGFSGQEVQLTAILRKIESAGYGIKRDHFFHSFQNYFFGLYAVLELKDLFCLYDTRRRIKFDVNPIYIWFLTALWHDVGYGVEKSPEILNELYGEQCAFEMASRGLETFLDTAYSKRCLGGMASLIARLTSASAPSANWMEPQTAKRTSLELSILKALRRNVSENSHGVASSLRMFADCMPRIARLTNDKQLLPRQCLWIACSSAPFHDYHFRLCLREETGKCLIPTDALPFAALLAFIDSIQDDRRNISALQEEIQFLNSLHIDKAKGMVTADVEPSALKPSSIFWKMIEARDVAEALHCESGSLGLKYPQWMAG